MSAGEGPSGTGSINFHVHALASSLFKGATRYYTVRFGVGLPEMRILSNLDRQGPLPAHRLVTLTAMDKALISRVLAALERRSYIAASPNESDPRRRTWRLTRAGEGLVKRLRPVWQEREAIIQAGLSPEEREQLLDMLIRMFEASEKLRVHEAKHLLGPQRPATVRPQKPKRKPVERQRSSALGA